MAERTQRLKGAKKLRSVVEKDAARVLRDKLNQWEFLQQPPHLDNLDKSRKTEHLSNLNALKFESLRISKGRNVESLVEKASLLESSRGIDLGGPLQGAHADLSCWQCFFENEHRHRTR